MAKILSVLFLFSVAEYCYPVRNDICSSRHVRRVFSRLGESGDLGAYNVGPSSDVGVGLLEECKAEIVACPSCVVSLAFRYINLSCHCESRGNIFLYNPCRSDYVRVTEPPYEAASAVSFCGIHTGSGVLPRRLQYKSKTRTVRVSLFYSKTHTHAFTMNYTSEPNRQLFIGESDHQPGTNLSSGYISSPFFPTPYPKHLVVDYLFLCKRHPLPSLHVDLVDLQDDFNCRIHLVFTDFQLAAPSFIEFYEGSHLVASFSGTSFRLPIIMSSTNSLTARFFASGDSNVGFKAFFSFISKDAVDEMVAPVTDCGGLVGNFGGAITMVNMVDSYRKKYYCVWLIRSGRSFLNLKSHLYLKVITFLNFEGDAHLEIRQGLTSESPLLEDLRYPASQNFQEHVIPIESSYHVTLKASFGPASHFAISYAEFTLSGCLGTSKFLCRNFRCISRKLTCDGFDHCGDNSDESELCYPGLERGVRRGGRVWPTLTANYYFPKAKQLSGWIVLLVSSLAIILLALGLTAVYRITTRARIQEDLEHRLQTISDLRDSFSDEVSVENVVIDDPPSYEPPPSYEEVVQMSLN